METLKYENIEKFKYGKIEKLKGEVRWSPTKRDWNIKYEKIDKKIDYIDRIDLSRTGLFWHFTGIFDGKLLKSAKSWKIERLKSGKWWYFYLLNNHKYG